MTQSVRKDASSKPGKSSKHRRATSVAGWLVALPLATACASVLIPDPPYVVDLVANFAAQWALFALALGVLLLCGRAWLSGTLLLIAAAACIMTLASGRAAILPIAGPVTGGREGSHPRQSYYRALHFNCSAGQTEREMMRDITGWNADIVAITEPSGTMWGARGAFFGVCGPDYHGSIQGDVHYRTAFWADDAQTMLMGSGLIASRWPMEHWEDPEFLALGPVIRRLIVGRVELPDGPILVIGAHPRSPRDSTRWAFGNEDVEAVAATTEIAQRRGLPVLVLADLNATPSGWRSRRLENAGLRRTKPLLTPVGTWPTDAVPGPEGWLDAWPLRIAIDDALVSPEWTVLAWGRGDSRGSDHWPIIVDLKLDRQKPTPNEPVEPPAEPSAEPAPARTDPAP